MTTTTASKEGGGDDGKGGQEEGGGGEEDAPPALFTSFCHGGLEVIFVAINTPRSSPGEYDDMDDDRRPPSSFSPSHSTCHLLGIHARTRVPFQKCRIVDRRRHDDDDDGDDGHRHRHRRRRDDALEIVQLASHPTSGWIYAADNRGNVHSFRPVRSDPHVEAYGKYRWSSGTVARCRDVFFGRRCDDDDDYGRACFHRRGRTLARRRRPSRTVSPGSRDHVAATPPPGKSGAAASSSRGIYPLADNPPPLPAMDFGGDDDDDEDDGDNATSTTTAGHGVMICASMTERRVLIAHRDQLAIYDFSLSSPPVVADAFIDDSPSDRPPMEAHLLWTHKLRGCVIDRVSLSGDGSAIALSLLGEGVGVPYPFGVRTFVRDVNDGSGATGSSHTSDGVVPSIVDGGEFVGGGDAGMTNVVTANTGGGPPIHPPPQTQSIGLDGSSESESGEGSRTTTTTTTAARSDGGVRSGGGVALPLKRGGILYKPAQFLVHSAPVTRLAFRGHGTRTSSAHHNSSVWNEIEEGNDLLLTTCSSDCSVRIFSQNSWRQLMQWNSPPRSRADWVRGISAANLGDLDSAPTSSTGGSNRTSEDGNTPNKRGARVGQGQTSPMPKEGVDVPRHSSHSHDSQHVPHQKRSGENSISSDPSGDVDQALLTTKYTQPATFSSNSHSIPGTHAGAWIAELTFRNTFPALRLSRLSYMKTGGNDALPAHFESVAAILPPGSIAEEVGK
jgi:hypothetical protein